MELSIHNVRSIKQDHWHFLGNPEIGKTRIKHIEITTDEGQKITLALFTEHNHTMIEGELDY